MSRESRFFRNVAMEPLVTRTTHDFTCPECWIDERQLEDTVTTNGASENVKYVFLPYERNPDMPQEGRDRKEGASALESVTVRQAGERSRERGCRLSPCFVACCARRRGPRRKYRLVLQFESTGRCQMNIEPPGGLQHASENCVVRVARLGATPRGAVDGVATVDGPARQGANRLVARTGAFPKLIRVMAARGVIPAERDNCTRNAFEYADMARKRNVGSRSSCPMPRPPAIRFARCAFLMHGLDVRGRARGSFE